MNSWVRGNRFLLLPILAVIAGALLGEIAWHFQIRYTVTYTRPWGSGTADGGTAVFKELEPILYSVESLDKYAQSEGLLNSTMVAVLRDQFASGLKNPLQIEREFTINRSEVRNLPDSATREMFKQPRSELRIVANAADAASARQLADLGLDYAYKTFLRARLFHLIQDLSIRSKTDRATYQHQLAATQISLDSTKRQVAAMQALREKYQEVPLSAGEPVSAAGESVNLTTTSTIKPTRFLSPIRQLIGVESELADLKAEEQEKRIKLVRAEIGARVADRMLPLFASNAGAVELLKTTFNELANVESGSHAESEALAAREMRTQIEEPLVTLQLEFVDYKSYLLEPRVFRTGARRYQMVLLGMASALGLFLALWWALANAAFLRRQVLNAAIMKE